MKCFIYRNLHKPGVVYSIKAMEGEHKGKVVGYAETMYIKNPQFVVYEAGRQRVLKTKHKNVHAGIIGEPTNLFDYEPRLPTTLGEDILFARLTGEPVYVTYNPYKYSTFVDRETKEPVLSAWLCIIDKTSITAW